MRSVISLNALIPMMPLSARLVWRVSQPAKSSVQTVDMLSRME